MKNELSKIRINCHVDRRPKQTPELQAELAEYLKEIQSKDRRKIKVEGEWFNFEGNQPPLP